MKKLKYLFQLIKYRFKGLRLELKLLLFLSIISILLTELYLNKIPSINHLHFDLGRIYLKLCYAYFSAFIFYYLIVYAPKERKKVKAYLLINNIIHSINGHKNGILLNIIKISEPHKKTINDNLTLLEIQEYCKLVDPNQPITFHRKHNVIHPSFYDFLNYRAGKLKSYINDLIAINDLMDDDLFLSISNLNNIITETLVVETVDKIYMTDLEFISNGLYNLHFEVNELKTKYSENYQPRYNFQFHHNERKRNKRRKLK